MPYGSVHRRIMAAMRRWRASGRIASIGVLVGLISGWAAMAGAQDSTATFGTESARAMRHMMAAMNVAPSGSSDRDFVAMMVPHHEGAIAMALAELRLGKDERLKRIAQEIVIEQQQEIAAMRLYVGQPLPPSSPAATAAQGSHAMQEGQ